MLGRRHVYHVSPFASTPHRSSPGYAHSPPSPWSYEGFRKPENEKSYTIELIPEEVRGKVKKWSDYIDYWAVDGNFQNDTFMQDWVTYRTRRDRKLALISDPHTYDKP